MTRLLDRGSRGAYKVDSMGRTQRILEVAAQLLREGWEPIEAIEEACNRVSTTRVAKERARDIFMTLAAKMEREMGKLEGVARAS